MADLSLSGWAAHRWPAPGCTVRTTGHQSIEVHADSFTIPLRISVDPHSLPGCEWLAEIGAHRGSGGTPDEAVAALLRSAERLADKMEENARNARARANLWRQVLGVRRG